MTTTSIKLAEDRLIATVNAAAEALESVGTTALDAALRRLHEAQANATARITSAYVYVSELLGETEAQVTAAATMIEMPEAAAMLRDDTAPPDGLVIPDHVEAPAPALTSHATMETPPVLDFVPETMTQVVVREPHSAPEAKDTQETPVASAGLPQEAPVSVEVATESPARRTSSKRPRGPRNGRAKVVNGQAELPLPAADDNELELCPTFLAERR